MNKQDPPSPRIQFYGRHFQIHFLNENIWTEIYSINNNLALVKIMTWRRTGDRPLSDPMMTQFTDIYASPGPNVSQIVLYCTNVQNIRYDRSIIKVWDSSDSYNLVVYSNSSSVLFGDVIFLSMIG